MHTILKSFGGVLMVVGTVSFFLACVFAPFGIVWLVLSH